MDGAQGLGAGRAAVRDSKPDMGRRQQEAVTAGTELYMTVTALGKLEARATVRHYLLYKVGDENEG